MRRRRCRKVNERRLRRGGGKGGRRRDVADGNTAERLAPAVGGLGFGLEEKGKLEGGAGTWRPRGGMRRERVKAGGTSQQGFGGKGGGAGRREVKRDGVRARAWDRDGLDGHRKELKAQTVLGTLALATEPFEVREVEGAFEESDGEEEQDDDEHAQAEKWEEPQRGRGRVEGGIGPVTGQDSGTRTGRDGWDELVVENDGEDLLRGHSDERVGS